jgi:hypothetical protein
MRKGRTKSPAPAQLDTIYPNRQPRRPHHIREWMEHRQIESQAELAKAIDADKSLVSRWLDEDKPTTPGADWQRTLNAYFGGDGDPVDIFKHPMDDWFVKFFRDKSQAQIERGKKLLEAAFDEDAEPRRKTSNRT